MFRESNGEFGGRIHLAISPAIARSLGSEIGMASQALEDLLNEMGDVSRRTSKTTFTISGS